MVKAKRKYNRLVDIMRKGYNNKTREELLMVRYFPVKVAIGKLSRCIQDTKINGKCIRKERQATMIKVLEVLYTFLHKSKTGQVNPSMRTLAFLVNPGLIKPNRFDTKIEAKAKERAIHATEMSVQRAIKTLQEIGMITVHQYYIDTNHFLSNKHACFFYELTPLSCYSKIYLDTREDKYGRKFKPKANNVQVPGVSTSNSIVTPKTISQIEQLRAQKEEQLYKEKLKKECLEAQAFEAKLLNYCRNPKSKQLGTLSDILRERKAKEIS